MITTTIRINTRRGIVKTILARDASIKMQLAKASPTLLSLLFTIFTYAPLSTANPFPIDLVHDAGYGYLEERACHNYCGVDRFCCSDIASAACSTDANSVAYCVAEPTGDAAGRGGGGGGGGGSYTLITTVITMTDLVVRTTVYTSWDDNSYVATTTITGYPPSRCKANEPACGSICCASYQTCAYENQCAARPSGDGAIPFSAPLLVTGPVTGAVTSTPTTTTQNPTAASASATETDAEAVATTGGDGGGGLSAGAIVGIVFGVLAAIALLILICFCCCLRAGLHGVLGILGLGKKNKRKSSRTETIETTERYSSRHSAGHSGAASRKEHKSWFGKPRRADEKKKGSGLGGFGAVGAGLLGLAAILGLKRKGDERKAKKDNRPPRPPPSDYSSTYYSTTYTGTSASKLTIRSQCDVQANQMTGSESSDDRRTRTTRTSRHR